MKRLVLPSVAALGWAALAWLCVHLLVSLSGALSPNSEGDIVRLGGASAIAFLLVTFGVLEVHERGAPLRRSLALRPTHPLLLLIGIGLGASLKLPAEALRELMERQWPSSDTELLQRTALFRSDTLGAILALLVVACLVSPLVEEIFFRGALYGRLARVSAPAAASVSGLAFVLAHSDFRAWPALAVVAAALGMLRALGGSLLPCIALHVAFNTVGVLGLVTRTTTPTSALNAPVSLVLTSWAFAGVLLVGAARLANDDITARARKEDEA